MWSRRGGIDKKYQYNRNPAPVFPIFRLLDHYCILHVLNKHIWFYAFAFRGHGVGLHQTKKRVGLRWITKSIRCKRDSVWRILKATALSHAYTSVCATRPDDKKTRQETSDRRARGQKKGKTKTKSRKIQKIKDRKKTRQPQDNARQDKKTTKHRQDKKTTRQPKATQLKPKT